jgi:hypothetical protein
MRNKFPFDVFGEIPRGASNECPRYTFFSTTKELCIVRDLFAVLKFPVLIGFFIWAVLAI